MEENLTAQLGAEQEATATEETVETAETVETVETAEAPAEPTAETTAEPVAPAVTLNILTSEELQQLTDEQLLDYLRTLTQDAPTARQILRAVGDIKADVRRRVDLVKQAEKAEQTTDEQTEGTPAEQTSQEAHIPSAWETSIAEILTNFDFTIAKEREELRRREEANAVAKQGIIDELQGLLDDTKENPSSVLRTVKELIARWKNIGSLPADKREMNTTFHNLTDQFFSKLKIDRELRELDMRRNLTEKTKLCEEAEALKDEPSASKAFFQIQRLHANWKALGPVPRENSDEIWNRFREATAIINKRMHKQAEADHEREKENYQAKLQLCEQAEALAEANLDTAKQVDNLTNKIQELQKQWRTIGYAPKELNDQIYARFRATCDKVFNAKRDFFKQQNSQLAENLKRKEELCQKAEAVMNNTDWRATSSYLIQLQKEWKEVGAVPYKQSDAIWKRFRKACDTFFDNRQATQDSDQTEMADNLTKKQAIIDELKSFVAPEDQQVYLKQVQAIMQKWNAIGFVPIKQKQNINLQYAELISKHFEALKLDPKTTELERYRTHVDTIRTDRDRLFKERNRLMTQIRQTEQDIETLENNICFFAKSKNAESIIADVQQKIDKNREELSNLNQKLSILEQTGNN